MNDLDNLINDLNNIKGEPDDLDIHGVNDSASFADIADDFSFDSLEMPSVDLNNLMDDDNAPGEDHAEHSRSGFRQVSRVGTFRAMPSMLSDLDDEEQPAQKKRRVISPSDDSGFGKNAFNMPRNSANPADADDLPSLKIPASSTAEKLPSLKAPAAGSKADDLPSLKIPSLGTKASKLPVLKKPGSAADDLPSLKSPAASMSTDEFPSLKVPSLSNKSARIVSPKPAGGFDDLPSIKSPAAAGDDLPSFKSPATAGDDLPSFKIPATAGDDLPSFKIPATAGDDLPSFKSPAAAGDDLPSFKIPATAGDDLPSFKSPATAGDDLPSFKIPAPAGDDLPRPKVFNAAKPAVMNEAPGMSRHQSLFASPQLNDAFATPHPGDAIHTPGGDFETKPPMGAEQPSMAADLFSSEMAGLAAPKSDRTPPVGGNANSGLKHLAMRDVLNDSSLGVPKLKLEEKGQPIIRGTRHPTGAFDESYDIDNDSGLPISDDPLGLFSNDSSSSKAAKTVDSSQLPEGDILNLFGNGVPELKKDNVNSVSNVAGVSSLETPSPIDMESSRFEASKIPAPVEAREEVSEQDEQLFDIQSIHSNRAPQAAESHPETAAKAKKSSSRTIMAICVAAVVLLSLGVAFYNLFLSDDANKPETPVTAPEPKKIVLSWPQVTTDQLPGYTRFYKQARDKLMEEGVSASERRDIQGKILTLFSLASTRYASAFADDVEMIDQSVAQIAETCDSEWCAVGLWGWGLFRDNAELSQKHESLITTQTDLKKLLQAANLFRKWTPEKQSYAEWTKAGDDILAALPDNDEFIKQWPLATWIRVKTLVTQGKITEASDALKAVYPDDASLKNPALIVLKSQILLAQNQNTSAKDMADRLRKMDSAAPEERDDALLVSMLAAGSLEDWAATEPMLTDFLKTAKANPAAPKIGATLCIHLNREPECRPIFHSMNELDAKNNEVRKAYVNLLMHELDPNEIVRPDAIINESLYAQIGQIIETGIQQSPDTKEYWSAKGVIEYAAGHYDEADKAFDEIERGTDMVWFGSFLSDLAEYREADEAGKKEIIKKLTGYAADITLPHDVVILAESLLYLGQDEVAGRLIERARQLHPDSTELINLQFQYAVQRQDPTLAKSLIGLLKTRNALRSEHEYGLAQLTEKMGDLNSALETMLVLMNREKDNTDFIYYVGQLFFKQGHYDSALKYFNDTLEIDPSNGWAHFYKGRALFELGRFEESLAAFNSAYSQDDTNFLFRLWHGKALEKAGQTQDAMRAYTSVIDAWNAVTDKSQSNVSQHDASEAFYHRAGIVKFQNRRPDAQRDFSTALELEPENIEYMAGYAIFMYESQQHKAAIEYLDKVENAYGSKMDARLCFVKGLTLLKLNKRSDAVKYFEDARDRGFAELPESDIQGVREPAEVYERLGYMYRDMGHKEEAKKSLNLFLEKSKVLSPAARLEVQREIDKI